MAATLWHFAIDAANQPRRITKAEAERLNEGLASRDTPRYDDGGYLIASVYVELENRVPTRIREIGLTPFAASPATCGHVVPRISVDLAENLRRAIAETIRRRRVRRLDFEDSAWRTLRMDIERGLYIGWTYTDLIGAARQRMLATRALKEGKPPPFLKLI